jgi:hypothetical protein
MKNKTNGNARMEFLKRKEQEIRQQLAAERAKSQQRAEREAAHVVQIVGKAAVAMAIQSPASFGVSLKQVLDTTVSEDRARELLRRKGLL